MKKALAREIVRKNQLNTKELIRLVSMALDHVQHDEMSVVNPTARKIDQLKASFNRLVKAINSPEPLKQTRKNRRGTAKAFTNHGSLCVNVLREAVADDITADQILASSLVVRVRNADL